MRLFLASTLRKLNPDFEYKFWTWNNVSRDNFPLTYDGILKVIRISEKTQRNRLSAATDLMRI